MYIFQRSGPTLNFFAKLVPQDVVALDQFGRSLAISDDVIVVGAPLHDAQGPQAGAAYVFRYNAEKSQWEQEAKLVASNAAEEANFGASVDIDGDVIAVGAAKFSGATTSSAYVYRHHADTETWVEEAILTEPSPVYNQFGYGVAVSGDVVAVAAAYHDVNKGAVFVYRHDEATSAWPLELMIANPFAQDFTYFGSDVHMDGDLILIGGAVYPETLGCGEIHAYSFRFDPKTRQWAQETVGLLTNQNCMIYLAGQWLYSQGDTALVGDWTHPNDQGQAGAIKVFTYNHDANAWELQTILDDGGSTLESFSLTVAISDGMVLGAALGDDDLGNNAGAVYVFDITGEFCCVADINDSNAVDVDDLLVVINSWGPCPPEPPEDCPADIAPLAGNGTVDVDDLLTVINGWGDCS